MSREGSQELLLQFFPIGLHFLPRHIFMAHKTYNIIYLHYPGSWIKAIIDFRLINDYSVIIMGNYEN